MESISVDIATEIEKIAHQKVVDMKTVTDVFGDQVIYAQLENGTKIIAKVAVKITRTNGPLKPVEA